MTFKLLRAAAVASVFLGAVASSQSAPVVVIHAGVLIDRPGEPVRREASVVIRGDRIESVSNGFVVPPPGAVLIDLKDRTVLPGLIDSHVHLESDTGGEAALVEGVRSSPADNAFRAAANGRKTLMAGFTTVRMATAPRIDTGRTGTPRRIVPSLGCAD